MDKMPDEINKITTWRQGRFIDQQRYKHWSVADKERADYHEKFLVRPSPTGNAICKCNFHEDAKWLAGRLNIAAEADALKAEHRAAMAGLCEEIECLSLGAEYGPDSGYYKGCERAYNDALEDAIELIKQRISDE